MKLKIILYISEINILEKFQKKINIKIKEAKKNLMEQEKKLIKKYLIMKILFVLKNKRTKNNKNYKEIFKNSQLSKK